VTRVGEEVMVETVAPRGMHVRLPGEDIAAGDLVIEAGVVLGAGQLAAAAALGCSHLSVQPPPRVAVVPTGNEVRGPGVALAPGEVYDAVSLPLAVLLTELGARPMLQPGVPDDLQGLVAALRAAAAQADAILTVGGVSVGERDLVRGLRSIGEVRGFQLALRPARPFAFGTAFDRPLFGLPGNPASALVAFEELVRPVLLHMMGRLPRPRPSATAVLAEPIRQTPGRMHLMRAKVWSEAGRLYAAPAGRQGAGMLHSLAAANAYAVVSAEVDELPQGSEIEVRLLGEL
ncbi:MAG: molybdopterin molybdotransferase MoeA, partial [Candidatus Methylomirabilales bacterium]